MRPLDGVTVVSLEQAIAGPFCTRQLADIGARVIRMASHFVCCNRSQESLTLDLEHPCGPFLADDGNTVMLRIVDGRAGHRVARRRPRASLAES